MLARRILPLTRTLGSWATIVNFRVCMGCSDAMAVRKNRIYFPAEQLSQLIFGEQLSLQSSVLHSKGMDDFSLDEKKSENVSTNFAVHGRF